MEPVIIALFSRKDAVVFVTFPTLEDAAVFGRQYLKSTYGQSFYVTNDRGEILCEEDLDD